MAVKRVQVIQKNVDLLVSQITDTTITRKMENVKDELRSILQNETQGTGDLARSVQVQRGTQRGKPIVRILTADYGRAFFTGTTTKYAGIPPSNELFSGAVERFQFWARRNNWNPRKLARVIAFGKSGGKVYSDRTNVLIRALRNGFSR